MTALRRLPVWILACLGFLLEAAIMSVPAVTTSQKRDRSSFTGTKRDRKVVSTDDTRGDRIKYSFKAQQKLRQIWNSSVSYGS